MNGPGPLGAFLQARRAQLRPEDVGLRDLGPRRRVAGLRREELAQLAGVSVSYYARLEQGQSRGASAEVLDAIARALLLDDHEREHLDRLAGTARHAPRLRRPRPEKLADETRDLLRAVDGVPAIVLGRRTDVLAWNALGHTLLAGHLDFLGPDVPARRPNMSRMLFLDLHCQELYADWKRKARAVVGNLRIAVGKYPDDPLLAELIGELTMKSPEFVALWADHRVAPCDAATYELRHPVVGTVTVTQQTLAVARSPEQALIVCTTPAGSSSEEALALLRQSSGSRTPYADGVGVPEEPHRQVQGARGPGRGNDTTVRRR
ncbi:helix-turn-helix transcriptional regulator [Streptomyces sp. NPDC048161]|jgi:transcriptional regulator with XRE-family HTH domain|uniref:helix-turn-helix domain-containing protein n=1 Tax=unclassified Streptomyces TaxID=2593676 RepID=UPI00081AF3F3|nr:MULTISPECIES: helix-turn-helix transcriptional regulator [unclassified Streptomyces]MYQ86890.1 helix-turn-helix domain-containing protein [Streptomyces sp. SID4936]SCE36424.1 Transcriptional regulator, contains XRE-family HTH domain [Streptomyces sp. DvalAA-43]